MWCRDVNENHVIDFNQWARAYFDRELRSCINYTVSIQRSRFLLSPKEATGNQSVNISTTSCILATDFRKVSSPFISLMMKRKDSFDFRLSKLQAEETSQFIQMSTRFNVSKLNIFCKVVNNHLSNQSDHVTRIRVMPALKRTRLTASAWRKANWCINCGS